MLTWRLWRALRYPDEINPLYQRIQAQPSVLPGRKLIRRLQPLWSSIAVLVSALVVLVAPLALFVMSNIYGALVAYNVMNTINRERDQQTYDLLALTPYGRGRSNWMIAAACVSRLDAVERLASLRSLALLTLILFLVYSLGGRTITPVMVVTLMLALNLDAIQSQVVGCLSGMLAQEFNPHAASFAALAIFVFAQVIVVYVPVIGVGIALFDALRTTKLDRWVADAILGGVLLALLYVLHEATIQVMWRELERRLL